MTLTMKKKRLSSEPQTGPLCMAIKYILRETILTYPKRKKKKKRGGSEKLLKVNNNKNCFGFSSQTHYTIIFLLLMMIFQENECNSCSQIHSKHIFYLPNKQKANNISINRCNLNLTLYTYILLIDKKLGKG